jgi:hypothetical protein
MQMTGMDFAGADEHVDEAIEAIEALRILKEAAAGRSPVMNAPRSITHRVDRTLR